MHLLLIFVWLPRGKTLYEIAEIPLKSLLRRAFFADIIKKIMKSLTFCHVVARAQNGKKWVRFTHDNSLNLARRNSLNFLFNILLFHFLKNNVELITSKKNIVLWKLKKYLNNLIDALVF